MSSPRNIAAGFTVRASSTSRTAALASPNAIAASTIRRVPKGPVTVTGSTRPSVHCRLSSAARSAVWSSCRWVRKMRAIWRWLTLAFLSAASVP
jgi:hypothetical protein